MCNYMCPSCYPSFVEKITADVMLGESECRDQPGPEAAIEFALALVERLYGKEKIEEVDGPLVSCKS